MTKLAFPTDDGETISRHFGQAMYFKIITLTEGQPAESELRSKARHTPGEHSHAQGEHPGQGMVDGIRDCQVLISGGMGAPALARADAAGMKVVLTRTRSIDEALKAYSEGSLENDAQLVHQHHEHHN
jgi:predicted Fe-Mo cluster-binding NifX family protein